MRLGFQTVDLRSNPTRFSLFFFLTYILAFFLGYFLIKHGIQFTNFARAEFVCMFSFVSLLFISLLTFPSSWRSICSVSINQTKIMIYKETIKWNSLGIVHDYCDCHETRILMITCTCSQRLCGKIIQISYHLESNMCIRLLSAFLSNYPVKKKRNKTHIF